MKKRTLNQTWVLCLRMWRRISKIWVEDDFDVHLLKVRWLSENGFGNEDIYCNCFFCDFAGDSYCATRCPGKLVEHSFQCDDSAYNYEDNPVAFYKELLRLNRIRKAEK